VWGVVVLLAGVVSATIVGVARTEAAKEAVWWRGKRRYSESLAQLDNQNIEVLAKLLVPDSTCLPASAAPLATADQPSTPPVAATAVLN
jgi:hypothetical protein